MKHEQRNNRVRYHGGRPPPWDGARQWRANGVAAGRPLAGPRTRVGTDLPGEGTAELGLTRTPPSRYRSLLVPLDGSPFGEHALPLALGIARRAGASVQLIHVHSPLKSILGPGPSHSDWELEVLLRRPRQAYLAGLLRRLAKATSVPVTPVLAEGQEVVPTLCKVGAATDLVVMASHRRGPLGRFWHGGVANALLDRLAAPLLLVRGHAAPVDLTGDPVPRHVLIPLDGSEAAEQALAPALDLGALTGADHTLLRVVRPGAVSAAGVPVERRRAAQERDHAEAVGYLRGLARRLEGGAARVHPRLLSAEQSVAASVLWYAEKNDADLIALARRDRGTLSRLFHGSVADQVIRRTATPVLVVRAAG